VPDRPETVPDVGVKHPVDAAVGLDPDHLARLASGAPRTEPVALRQEVGLEHRFKDQLRRRHRHPVPHARNPKRPGAARLAWLGDEDPPQRPWPVGPGLQLCGELLEEGRHPGRLHRIDGDPIGTRRPSVSTDLVPGPEQDVAAGDLVEQGMKTTIRLLLGAAVQHTLQGMGLVQAIGLRGGPSPHRALTDPLLGASASMKQGPFPSDRVVLSQAIKRYYDPLRLPGGRPPLPARRL
jgi:hypothetical protein